MINSKVIKKILDFILSCILLLLLSPVLIIVACLIKVNLGSPIIFSQKRIGLNNRSFNIYKFRTMKNTVSNSGELLSDNERVTRLGKILRNYSIDELPELFNILIGDMSFIGPRPLLEEYLPLYNERQLLRHSVLPGLSGWAQINGRNELSWREKFKLDLWYVENWSLILDIRIFFKTFVRVIKREGINQTELVTSERFNGGN